MSTHRALSVSLRPLLARQARFSSFLFQQQNQQRPWQQALRLGSVLAHSRGITPLILRTQSPAAIVLCNFRSYSSTTSPYPQQPLFQQPPPPEPQPKKRNIILRAFFFTVRAFFYTYVGLQIGQFIVKKTMLPDGLVYQPEYATEEDRVEAERIIQYLSDHPLVEKLNNDPELVQTNPHYNIPPAFRVGNLTADTLVGPGLMAIPPLTWQDEHGHKLVMIMHVGKGLCGHPNIVHGGFVATVLDEFMARCCFKAVPHNVAMTARLNIDYRAPTPAGEFIVLTAHTVSVDRRKAVVRGKLEVLGDPSDPENETKALLAEAEGLFVSPRQARTLQMMATISGTGE
ncbi:hypothetical protein Sste5346_000061 [Sporothrix stenoceras]|uniref:Thioesterase domain-containing protein n=1 Tax=Sporothrix stenoceras TaxID=5173 RepID=A0ABR3ZTX6_9PEZI